MAWEGESPILRGGNLHTPRAHSLIVSKVFSGLYARAYCHATESLDKVTTALQNLLGGTEPSIRRTEGVHGNPIVVLESSVEDDRKIREFFRSLSTEDLDVLMSTLGSRIDDGCNLFIRMDKQAALRSQFRISRGEDAISVRLRVRAFPAKPEIANGLVLGFLEQEARDRQTCRTARAR